MSKIEIYGESDDIITIDGDYDDEVEAIDGRYLLFADGTVISGEFEDDGVWRFKVERQGQATVKTIAAPPRKDSAVSERVILEYPGDLAMLWNGDEMPPAASTDDLVRAAKIHFDLTDAGLLEDRNALGVILRALTEK